MFAGGGGEWGAGGAHTFFFNFRDIINITALVNGLYKTFLKTKEAALSVSIPTVLKSGLA